MAKPYPPIRALVIRSLEDGQKTANQLRAEFTPDADSCMSMARLVGDMVRIGIVRTIALHRSKNTDPMHAYALAVPLKQALAADKAELIKRDRTAKDRRRANAIAKHGPKIPKEKKQKAEPVRVLVDIPAGAIQSRVAGGGDCYTLGNRRIFKLEGAKRKLATDCIGNKIAGGTGFSSCLMEVSL